MIYLFAPETDVHALEIIQTKALAGCEIQHLTADFFLQNGVSLFDGYVTINGRQLQSTDVLVYRRNLDFHARLEGLGYLGAERTYLARTLDEHADSFLFACEEICRVVNPRSRHRLALSKPQQLRAARKFDFNAPATIFSNNISDIQMWLEGHERAIIKPYSAGFELTGGRSGCVKTVEIKVADFDGLSFGESPMIVQQFIESDDEIRIIVRPGSLLGFSLGWCNKLNGVDWRPHQEQLNVTVFEIPPGLAHKITMLCDFLGVGLGTIDLIRFGQELFFLEANLAGNY